MSASKEQVYISLLPCSAAVIPNHNVSNLKGTELRLGLPGSESPKRRNGGLLKLWRDSKDESINGGPYKNVVLSGAKRGFCDAMNDSTNWGLNVHGVDLKTAEAFLSNTTDSKSSRDEISHSAKLADDKNETANTAPASKVQIVGWPPVRSFCKNSVVTNSSENNSDLAPFSFYVKVSMDGAPYLRKIDLKTYSSYTQLSSALEKMFSCFTIGQYEHHFCGQDPASKIRLMDLLYGSEYVLTYEDKDGDWMLVGDVPWEMFMVSCKRLRITKGSEAIGLGNHSHCVPAKNKSTKR